MNWSEALESKYEALRDSIRARDAGYESDGHSRKFGAMERYLLPRADPYYWATEILDAVRGSSESLPDDTALSFDRFQDGYAGWFWSDRIVALPGELEEFQGVLWSVHNINGVRRLGLSTYRRKDGYLQVIDSVYIDEGKTIGQMKSGVYTKDEAVEAMAEAERQGLDGLAIRVGDRATGLCRLLIAQILWLEQEVLVAHREQAVRATRRRLTAAGISESSVKVVVLRRAVREASHSPGDSGREYTCQWVVRGHWRQQFYPSTGERSPLWIMPYVKGPDDAPLKTPSATVFAVTR